MLFYHGRQDVMGYVRLESVDPAENRYRYYIVSWLPTLWGTWGVLCEWGRIGQDPRGAQVRECADRDEALWVAAEVIDLRLRHGYVVTLSAKVNYPPLRRRSCGGNPASLG